MINVILIDFLPWRPSCVEPPRWKPSELDVLYTGISLDLRFLERYIDRLDLFDLNTILLQGDPSSPLFGEIEALIERRIEDLFPIALPSMSSIPRCYGASHDFVEGWENDVHMMFGKAPAGVATDWTSLFLLIKDRNLDGILRLSMRKREPFPATLDFFVEVFLLRSPEHLRIFIEEGISKDFGRLLMKRFNEVYAKWRHPKVAKQIVDLLSTKV